MLDRTIELNDKLIDSESSPFIIAEVGSNFNQNLDTAKKLIKIASESKADAVKFQLFNSDVLYPKKAGLYNIFKSNTSITSHSSVLIYGSPESQLS